MPPLVPLRRDRNKDAQSCVQAPHLVEYDLDPLRALLLAELVALVQNQLGSLRQRKVLFLGGGLGREIHQLHAKGWHGAINADINLTRLQEAKKFARARGLSCLWVVADGMALPFRDKAFDAVIAYESMHHMDDVLRCLSECLRVAHRVCIVDRRQCWVTQLGRMSGLIRPEYDGVFAQPLQIGKIRRWLATLNATRIISIQHHFWYLLVINRSLHTFLSGTRIRIKLHRAFVRAIQTACGRWGNGVVMTITDKNGKTPETVSAAL